MGKTNFIFVGILLIFALGIVSAVSSSPSIPTLIGAPADGAFVNTLTLEARCNSTEKAFIFIDTIYLEDMASAPNIFQSSLNENVSYVSTDGICFNYFSGLNESCLINTNLIYYLAACYDDVTFTYSGTPLSVTFDKTGPVLSAPVEVTTPTIESDTRSYTFTSDEAGTITCSGGCACSANPTATIGVNTITLDALTVGIYSACTVQVTDVATNPSNILTLASFVVNSNPPVPAPLAPAPTHSGGSSGGCMMTWTCTEWTGCIDGIQTRTCSYNTNYCKPREAKPAESQSCTIITELIPTTEPTSSLQEEQTNTQGFNAITGAVTGALGTTGSITLIIIIIVGVGVAYWLVRKNKMKRKGNVGDKVKWKGKKE